MTGTHVFISLLCWFSLILIIVTLSTFIGLPQTQIAKLQRVQNAAVHVVINRPHWVKDYLSITQCLFDLHWLPCKFCIIFKILCLTHKAVWGQAPGYLNKLFHRRAQKGHKHDPDDILLIVLFTQRKTFADRSLSVQGPKHWNEILTKDIRLIQNHELFKKCLKTLLFSKAFAVPMC